MDEARREYETGEPPKEVEIISRVPEDGPALVGVEEYLSPEDLIHWREKERLAGREYRIRDNRRHKRK